MADGAGVVEAAGAEVTEFKLGDHVAPGQPASPRALPIWSIA
jgi:NADPH:quinone reductase-like Zn-dependent oxidoreductase